MKQNKEIIFDPINISKIIINNKIDNICKEFIENSLKGLKNELNQYYHSLKDNHIYKEGVVYDVFQYNERAILGFYTNGIIRNDKNNNYSAIQEYCINHKDGNSRVDLLLISKSPKVNYLFEAKHYYTNSTSEKNYTDSDTEELLKSVHKQAIKYLNKEENFHKEESTYIVNIVFETIDFKGESNYLESVEKYDPKIKNYFYAFYHSRQIPNEGLAVYGTIISYK